MLNSGATLAANRPIYKVEVFVLGARHPQIEALFNKAGEALGKRNYDYAIDLYRQCVTTDHGYGEAWAGLLNALTRKTQELGLTGSKITQKLTGGLGWIKSSAVKNIAPSKQIESGLGHLAGNPMDLGNRMSLARALEAEGNKESALAVYQSVADLDPKNSDAFKGAGAMNQQLGRIADAQVCYNNAYRANPADYEVTKAIKELAALETMGRGLSDAKSFTETLKDKDQSAALEKRQHLLQTDAEVDGELLRLRRETETAPDDVKTWKALASFLFDKMKDYPASRDAFRKASDLNPSDGTLWMKAEDCTLRIYDAQLAALEPQVRAAPEDAAKGEMLRKVRIERLRYGVQTFEKRVKAYPTDMGLLFELGRFCYELAAVDRAQAGTLIDRAIAAFQQTVKDPKRKVDSHDHLGNAFRYKKMYDMAVDQFKKALETGIAMTGKQGLRIVYNMARTYEDEGKSAEALVEYKKILSIDFIYRDVSQRVERLMKG